MVDAGATAYVWVDSNCNSIPDADEVPLPGVCIWHGDSALSSPPRPDYCDIDSNLWCQILMADGTRAFFGIEPAKTSIYSFVVQITTSQQLILLFAVVWLSLVLSTRENARQPL